MEFERVTSDRKGIRLVQEFCHISAIFNYSRGKFWVSLCSGRDNKWKDWNKENWKYKQWWVIFAILRKDLVKFYQLTLLFQSQSSINAICSLPADVLWGSFVTHSFLPRDKRTPKDVCREAMRYAVYTKQVPGSISLGYQEHPFQR